MLYELLLYELLSCFPAANFESKTPDGWTVGRGEWRSGVVNGE